MAPMTSASSPRPVWLDDKTKSIMDRAIAREQIAVASADDLYRHRSGFHAPARNISWRVESHQDQQPRSSGIYLAQLGFRHMAMRNCSVGWALSSWASVSTPFQNCGS